MSRHRAGRPHWHCTACGQRWPCATAKRDLRRTVADGRAEEVKRVLESARQDAERDFQVLGILAEQGDLHDRFVAWLRTR